MLQIEQVEEIHNSDYGTRSVVCIAGIVAQNIGIQCFKAQTYFMPSTRLDTVKLLYDYTDVINIYHFSNNKVERRLSTTSIIMNMSKKLLTISVLLKNYCCIMSDKVE